MKPVDCKIQWHKHLVFDNFLELEHYKQVCRAHVPESPGTHGVTAYGNIDDRLQLANIAEYYHDRLIGFLHQLAPEKVKEYTWTNLAINLVGPHHEFDIHTDHENKLLSVVVYLLPETSTGTFCYSDCQGNNAQEVPWKPNRAFIFSRTDSSWHNYLGDGNHIRRVLIMSLITDKHGW